MIFLRVLLATADLVPKLIFIDIFIKYFYALLALHLSLEIGPHTICTVPSFEHQEKITSNCDM